MPLYHLLFLTLGSQACTNRKSCQACPSGSPKALDTFLHIPYYLSDHWCCRRSHRQQQTLDVRPWALYRLSDGDWTWITNFLLHVYAFVSKQMVLYTPRILPNSFTLFARFLRVFFFLLMNTRFILI